LHAIIRLWDYPSGAIEIRLGHGQVYVDSIAPEDVGMRQPDLVFETRGDLLRRTMRSPYGRDLISVGYGAEVHLRSHAGLDGAANEPLLDLLSPQRPRWRHRIRKHPLRTLGFMLGDPSMRHALASRWLRKRGGARPAGEPGLYEVRDWARLAQVAE
jgi:hypothetical protein